MAPGGADGEHSLISTDLLTAVRVTRVDTVDRVKTAWLPLAGVVNARDVGGLPTSDGRTVRYGRLYRSDNLQQLTRDDIEALIGPLGLRSVVDLRTSEELQLEGPGPLTEVDGVRIHHLSLFPERGQRTDAADVPADEPLPDPVLPWQEENSPRGPRAPGSTYRTYLLERPDSIVAALRVIAEPDGATLVHCAAGKDRTGVVVALALSEVGVEREAVVTDYVATSERIRDVLRRLAATPTYARDVDADDADNVDRHLPRADTMHTLLAQIDEQDGGVPHWLRGRGWTERDAAALRTRLLDE